MLADYYQANTPMLIESDPNEMERSQFTAEISLKISKVKNVPPHLRIRNFNVWQKKTSNPQVASKLKSLSFIPAVPP